jgi:hypothetical protein
VALSGLVFGLTCPVASNNVFIFFFMIIFLEGWWKAQVFLSVALESLRRAMDSAWAMVAV